MGEGGLVATHEDITERRRIEAKIAHLAHHDGIDDLQMRRSGGQRQVDVVAVELAVRGGAEVVFDVAGAFDRVR
ncbi:hypothetical protein ACSTHE_00110, partial [Vibrio parahaemolyticus]